jgi:glycosyltransferase involved in cell wall biosynthesis
MNQPPRYIVISPVKDEERHVEHTLRSMANQTVKPVKWIIVDDGSSDRTPSLIEQYRTENDFIQVIQNPPGRARQPGGGVVRAFNAGYEAVKSLEYDVIVKLDCDLSFEPDYFEKLLRRFTADPKLGIASGVYLEDLKDRGWTVISMPTYHAAGASKIVRRTCFDEINGFVASRGWDTVDEIRAMARGWKTTHFPDAQMKHWKPEGAGIGRWRTNIMHGEIYYLTGGGFLFFAIKVLHRMRSRPYVLNGLALFWGYLRSALKRKDRLVTPEEAHCYRSLLNQRLFRKSEPVAGN